VKGGEGDFVSSWLDTVECAVVDSTHRDELHHDIPPSRFVLDPNAELRNPFSVPDTGIRAE
jgi:hypothetical protein